MVAVDSIDFDRMDFDNKVVVENIDFDRMDLQVVHKWVDIDSSADDDVLNVDFDFVALV